MRWTLGGLLVALWCTIAVAQQGPGKKCAIAKRTAAAKMVADGLKCDRVAAAKGVPVSQRCLDTAAQRLTAAFARIEARGECPIAGNAALVAHDVNLFVAQLSNDIGSTSPTTTLSGSTTTTTLCFHCPDLLAGNQGACPGSQLLANALSVCLCSGPCAIPCANTCSTNAVSAACDSCANATLGGCGTQFQACQGDQ
jgi:hypothetical protein